MQPFHRRLLVAALGLTPLLALAPRDASAQLGPGTTPQQKAAVLVTPKPPVAVNMNPPTKPALPAGCAEPTLAQCTTKATYDGGCFADPTKKKGMLDFCTWVIRNEWYKSNASGVTTLFPTSSPNSLSPIITPARKIDRGKNFPAGNQTISPAGRRRFAGTTPPAPQKGAVRGTAPASAQVSAPPPKMNWTPTNVRASNGSFASTSFGTMMSGMNMAAQEMEFLMQPNARATDPQVMAKANTIDTALAQPPPFAPTPGSRVTSCQEYAYKRWGDYSRFARYAKMLGRNYRTIYALANEPNLGINKTLFQTGTQEKTPKQTIEKLSGSHYQSPQYDPLVEPPMNHEIYLPLNPYGAVKASWIRKPGMPITATQITAVESAIAARWSTTTDTPVHINVKSDRSPLGVHREAKARFDSVYGNPHDDELADVAKRKKTYHSRLAERLTILGELVCAQASDPCYQCRPRPAPPQGSGSIFNKGLQLPSGMQKVFERTKGWPVINPSDMNSYWQTGNPARDQQSLLFIEQMGGAIAELEGAAGVRVNAGTAGGGGLRKEKSVVDLAQIKAGTGGTTPQAPGGPMMCQQQLAVKRNALLAALDATEKTLTRLLVNELNYAARGCLTNPGTNNVNLCDWSYELMASEVSSLFDQEVEADYKMCVADITSAGQAAGVAGFEPVVKDSKKQPLVFPCVWRGDFGVNAPMAKRFMDMNASYLARSCEVWYANHQVQQQQQAITDDVAGMKWKPSDGELYDEAIDALEIGDRSALGAFFDYSTAWKLKRTGFKSNSDPTSACKFDSSAKSKVAAGIDFFGERLELALLDGGGTGTATGTTGSVIFQYFDFQTRTFRKPMDARISNPAQETLAPGPEPLINLGGGEVDFWFMIGPVPIHVVFGAVATAGVGYTFTGKAGDNCANLNGPSNFKAISEIEPYARADAYADAAVDVVVVSAGVRLDLLLLRLGVPLGVNVQNTAAGGGWRFLNGGRITINMLAGRLTGYVEVGVAPLEESFEATIFAWDGFHFDVATWGLDRTLSNGIVRIATAGTVTTENVACACPNAGGDANNFCCSMVDCSNTATCTAPRKQVNGTWRACAFREADVNAFAGADSIKRACKQFAK